MTPNPRLTAKPEPVPLLRVKGTGRTEMELYPAVQRLHAAILARYGGMQNKELDSRIWTTNASDGSNVREMTLEKPYTGLQRGVQVIGATIYFGPYFGE